MGVGISGLGAPPVRSPAAGKAGRAGPSTPTWACSEGGAVGGECGPPPWPLCPRERGSRGLPDGILILGEQSPACH